MNNFHEISTVYARDKVYRVNFEWMVIEYLLADAGRVYADRYYWNSNVFTKTPRGHVVCDTFEEARAALFNYCLTKLGELRELIAEGTHREKFSVESPMGLDLWLAECLGSLEHYIKHPDEETLHRATDHLKH